MAQTESITDFYKRVPAANAFGLPLNNAGPGHFNIFSREACAFITPYSRRDYYKISLIIGTGKLHYADKWIAIDRPALLFSNPAIPYSWEAESDVQQGWFCLFTETFMQQAETGAYFKDSPLFRVGGNPVYFLDPPQKEEIAGIFKKMAAEITSDYVHKYDLLRHYLHLIIHLAIKMRPAESFKHQSNASSRIATLFLELLERQFPIDSAQASLSFKTANDFAHSLSVHTNHLNRAVKEVTGKTTTEHISNRIIHEAKALLRHTNWTVAEISYSLGFEYPAYFNLFFKKHAGVTPGEARLQPV
jgi:AraC family transcriptional activator of pobA